MTILSAFIPTETADLVAILNVDGEQVFARARPLKASISPEIKYMTHPVEKGGNITDHRVILPDIVTLSVVLEAGNYRDTYQAIKQAARSSIPFIIQTKSDTFNNMQITAYPSEEDPTFFDTLLVNVAFREIQFDAAQIQILAPDAVSNNADTSTVDRGEVQGTDATSENGSLLFRVFG